MLRGGLREAFLISMSDQEGGFSLARHVLGIIHVPKHWATPTL